MRIFSIIKQFFYKSVHHLFSQILKLNHQSVRIIRPLGCYRANEISIDKINLCNAEETQKLHLKRRLNTLFNAGHECI